MEKQTPNGDQGTPPSVPDNDPKAQKRADRQAARQHGKAAAKQAEAAHLAAQERKRGWKRAIPELKELLAQSERSGFVIGDAFNHVLSFNTHMTDSQLAEIGKPRIPGQLYPPLNRARLALLVESWGYQKSAAYEFSLVAQRFAPDVRRDDLTYTDHAEAHRVMARLDANEWTVPDLDVRQKVLAAISDTKRGLKLRDPKARFGREQVESIVLDVACKPEYRDKYRSGGGKPKPPAAPVPSLYLAGMVAAVAFTDDEAAKMLGSLKLDNKIARVGPCTTLPTGVYLIEANSK